MLISRMDKTEDRGEKRIREESSRDVKRATPVTNNNFSRMARTPRNAAVKARSSLSTSFTFNPEDLGEGQPNGEEVEEGLAGLSKAAGSGKEKGKGRKRKAEDEDGDDDSEDEFKLDDSGKRGEEDEEGEDGFQELEADSEEDQDQAQDQEEVSDSDSHASTSNKKSSVKKPAPKRAGGSSSKGLPSSSASKGRANAPPGGGSSLNNFSNAKLTQIRPSAKSSGVAVFHITTVPPTFDPTLPKDHPVQLKPHSEPINHPINFLKVSGERSDHWPESDGKQKLAYSNPNDDEDSEDVEPNQDGFNDIIMDFQLTPNLFNLQQVRDVGWYPGKMDLETQRKWTEDLDRENLREEDKMELDEDEESQAEDDTKSSKRLVGMPFKGKPLRHKVNDLRILNQSQAEPYLNPSVIQSKALRPLPTLHYIPTTLSTSTTANLSSTSNPKGELFSEPSPRISGDALEISLGPPGCQVKASIPRGKSLRLESVGKSSTFNPSDEIDIDQEDEPEEQTGNEEGEDGPEEKEKKREWWRGTQKGGHLLNVGGSVYALDFRPLPPHICEGSEFLAVSSGNSKNDPFPRVSYGTQLTGENPDSIQIWEIQSDFKGSRVSEAELVNQNGKQASQGKGKASKGKGKEKEPSSKGKGRTNEVSNVPDYRLEDQIKGQAIEVLRICTKFGKAIELKWFPGGHDYLSGPQHSSSSNLNNSKTSLRRLGILAGVFLDGTVRLFSVPHPHDVDASSNSGAEDLEEEQGLKAPIYLNLDPVLTLAIPNKVATSLSWGGERLAVGYSDGWLAVWNVGKCLDQISSWNSADIKRFKPKPSHYLEVNDSTIINLSFLVVPSLQVGGEYSELNQEEEEETGSGEGKGKGKGKGKSSKKEKNKETSKMLEQIDYYGNPDTLLSCGTDGKYVTVDLRDPHSPNTSCAQRDFAMASTFYPPFQAPLADETDNAIRSLSTRMGSYGQSVTVDYCSGRVLGLASSEFHPFVASASSGGFVKVVNALRNLVRRSVRNRLSFPIYKLEMNRTDGSLRMLDNLAPTPATFTLDSTNADSKSKIEKAFKPEASSASSAGWHPSISIRNVTWSPNIGRCLLLASGTGCGLVRLDWVDNKGMKVEEDQAVGKSMVNKARQEIGRRKEKAKGKKPSGSAKTKAKVKEEQKEEVLDEEMDYMELEDD